MQTNPDAEQNKKKVKIHETRRRLVRQPPDAQLMALPASREKVRRKRREESEKKRAGNSERQ